MIGRKQLHGVNRNGDSGERTDAWSASPPRFPLVGLPPRTSAPVAGVDTSSVGRAEEVVVAIFSRVHRRPVIARLALAIVAIGAATLMTAAVRSVADETMYVFFVGAVALVTWVDGLAFGVGAVVASMLAVDMAFIEPIGGIRLFSLAPVAQLTSFGLVAGLIAVLTDALARARRDAEREAREADQAKAIAENAAAAKGEIAKADAGRLELDDLTVSANLVVDEAVSLVLPQAIAKRVEVVVAPAVPPIQFRGDANRAREIVVNVLSNALKFAPKGSVVRIGVGRRAPGWVSSRVEIGASSVWIRVTDQGPGIEESDQELIFQPFVQGSARRTASKPGTGLGLAISRRLSRLMGGDLVVESQVGKGASFTLWLPAAVFIMAALISLGGCGGEKKASSNNASGVPATPAAPPTTVGADAGALPGPAPGVPPAGTTGRMTALGDSIFHGQAAGGLCFTCHGPDAKGTPLAPSLVDHEWLTGNGSYAFIVQRITNGMPTPTAPYPGPMLPMGGAQLTTDQVRAVAAYVASISHSKG